MNAYEFIINLRDQATSNLRRIAQSIGVASDRSKEFTKDLKKNEAASKSLGSALGGLRGKLIGLFVGISLMSFTNQVITARAEYEKFSAVLENTFQSKTVGDGALAMLTEFAAKTPYQLNELTGGFIKLVNRGIYPTYEEMTKIGDLASSQGKSFDQLVEAILDGQSGEFERLKEFGIKASKSGDKVTLSFKGITKEVANNEQAIKDAIISYGGMKGVAGSMESVSKTLGGRLSNLSDQWWGFLVAVGGYGGGVIGDTLQLMSDGLAFVQQYLPEIAHWFNLLWQFLSPLITSVKDFFKAAIEGVFGISDTGSALERFGDIMSGVLLVVDWLSTGIATFLDWIKPLAPYIMDAAIAWGIFNAVIAISPLGWIIIAIMAVITAIGMVMKYTDGWGKSWTALGNLLKLWWEQVKADFRMGVDIGIYQFNRLRYSAFEIFDKIGQKIANVGTAIKQALEFDFTGAYDTLNKKIESEYTKKIKENEDQYNKNKAKYISESGNRIKQAKKEIGDIGITVDSEGISRDFNKIKNSFKGIERPEEGTPEDYLNAIKNKGITAPGAGKDKDKDKKKKDKDGIVSGGTKQTHITINIGKLNEKIEVHTTNLKEGGAEIEAKMQELLLRAVNSVNQMQTG